LKKIIKEYWLLIIITIFILIFDQITKAIVRANIPFGGRWMPLEWLAPYFRFVHWENTGAAFGLFQQGGVVFGILAVIVSIFIVIYYPQVPKEATLMRVSLAMQLGGALGNLIDRIVFGPVTDFISVLGFPVFNIADSAITVGVGLLILGLWLSEQRDSQGADLEDQSDQENFEVPEELV
jgi:signal peptidase II